jgi:hypothetical protein
MTHRSIPAAAFALCLGLAPAGPLFAQPDLRTEAIKAMGMRSTLEGRVVVVNTETRMMTIRTADGSFEVLHVPPEVERLDRVRIGDQVSVTETTVALIEVQRGRDAGGMGMEASTQVERAPGNRPAGTLESRVTLFGQIVGINPANGTVEIRGANDTRTFELENKALLSELKVGDGVVVNIRDTITGEITVR